MNLNIKSIAIFGDTFRKFSLFLYYILRQVGDNWGHVVRLSQSYYLLTGTGNWYLLELGFDQIINLVVK